MSGCILGTAYLTLVCAATTTFHLLSLRWLLLAALFVPAALQVVRHIQDCNCPFYTASTLLFAQRQRCCQCVPGNQQL
jgi:hypothetical protein